MENGSFHASVQDESPVHGIPLPNQLPKGLDFSELPAAALKSATIESLISQNEDLMARLSVALRKNSQLEERLNAAETEARAHSHRVEAVQEQFLVLQQKEKVSGSRAFEVHGQNVDLKAKLDKLEKIYAELYVQAQAFQRRLVTLERYRARVRKAARPLQERAKRFPEVARELSEIKQRAAEEHMQTVNGYEARITEARTEIENMRGRLRDRDRIHEEKMQVENQLIFEQRKARVRDEEQSTELARLQSENSSLRFEVKEKLVAMESQSRELGDFKKRWPEAEEQIRALREQVESLQALWSHKQGEIEKAEEKNRSLQKLNQSLSQTLNQQRKEIHSVRDALEKERVEGREKIKVLQIELEQLRSQIIPER